MRTKSRLRTATAGAACLLTLASAIGKARDTGDRLVVHEWGTFTVLQDSHGEPIPGVNINEEALPAFVQRLAQNLAPESNELAPVLGEGSGPPMLGHCVSRAQA